MEHADARKTKAQRANREMEQSMDPRIFTRNVVAWTTDATRMCGFKAGGRVKSIRRIGKGVFFEPADPARIVATYTINWDKFIGSTSAVCEAGA
jgi:hypothetical protein